VWAVEYLGRGSLLTSLLQLLKKHAPLQIAERSKTETQKGLIFSIVSGRWIRQGLCLHKALTARSFKVGGSMIAVSLGQAGRRSRLSRMANTAAIKFGRWTNDSSGYSVGPAQVREQFEVSNVTARSQEFAGGFVDLLLGRGARHPR